MSHNGHLRAHGRRDVDLVAAFAEGDAPGTEPSTRPPAGSERPGASTAPRARGSGSPPARGSLRIRERSEGPSSVRPRPSTPARSRSSSAPGPDETRPRVRVVNLGLGGACIETLEPMAIGAVVTLEIVAPTLWDPLVLSGRVVWSRGDRGSRPRAGLAFEHKDAARAFALFELLGAHAYDSDGDQVRGSG